jgi:O-antigen ligase
MEPVGTNRGRDNRVGTVKKTGWGVQRLKEKRSIAYYSLVFFAFLYFMRPQDMIPFLGVLPLEKIGGGIALLALIFGVLPKERGKIPLELKVLLILLMHMILTIPFAYWRGGAFDAVFTKFSKGVIAGLLIGLIISSVSEMKKLLYIQAGSVAFITILSVAAHHTFGGRLYGIQKGILENPNDLAMNIAINFPLCMAFMFAAKGGLRKLIWAGSLIMMMYCVLITYSRSGMIALVITCLVCIWEYGVKQKRTLLLLGAGVFGVIALAVSLSTPHFIARFQSLTEGNIRGSGDRGSLDAREELLKRSIFLAVHNPIFGVGPGNFPVLSGDWHVAHNSYTELAAEAGFPALFLFILLFALSFRKVDAIRKLPGYAANENIRLWTSALWASLAAYVVGSMFASTEYNLFPYFMVGYVCALYRIASRPVEAPAPELDGRKNGQLKVETTGKREYAWTR